MMENCKSIEKLGLGSCSQLTDKSMIEICKILQYKLTTIGLNGITNLTDIFIILLFIIIYYYVYLFVYPFNTLTSIHVTLQHIQQYCTNMEILSLSQLISLSPLGIIFFSRLKIISLHEFNFNCLTAMQNLTTTCHRLGSIDLAKCTLMDDNVLFSIAKNCPDLFQLNVTSSSITDEGVISGIFLIFYYYNFFIFYYFSFFIFIFILLC